MSLKEILPITNMQGRSRVSLNSNWLFFRGDPLHSSEDGGACTQPDYDCSQWRELRLPHDWAVEEPFDILLPGETGKLNWMGVGWYRKHVFLPREHQGRRVYIEIDGAMSNPKVWVNGHYAGCWGYGYTSFEIDITPHFVFGEDNVIAIRLENKPESSRWYPGGGLYRNVWLRLNDPVAITYGGVQITTLPSDGDFATVTATVEVRNDSNRQVLCAALVHVRSTNISSETDEGLIPLGQTTAQALIKPGASEHLEVVGKIKNPRLWDICTPDLYQAQIQVICDGIAVDCLEETFGFRSIRFEASSGFWLNGRRLRLQGVCMHHDLGPLGAAINLRAMERQLQILRGMGCNAIRCCHNQPAPEWLELCDRMGFLVINEWVDCWKTPKKENGYNTLFEQWAEQDLRAWVRRDRNHPCVILWSVGNEIPEQLTSEGIVIGEWLRSIVKEEDPTRGVTAGMNYVEAAFNGFEGTVDVFGWNYKPQHYGKFIERNPDIPLIGSETASCVSSRGEYVFPVSENQSEGKARFHVSSYDLYAPPWASTPDTEFEYQDRHCSVAGEFVWTGFDYLGEPTPYNDDLTNLLNAGNASARTALQNELNALRLQTLPSRSSYFGILDLCGFRKDRFYLYQARWRPDFPMAHILPHWDWPERLEQITPVHVYTSGDAAELLLNGRSLGMKNRGCYDYRLRWDDVEYEPGELRVIAFKNGQIWAESVRQTTGDPCGIRATVDRAYIDPDGVDLAFIMLEIVDANNRVVPRADALLSFVVEGPGELVAVDNGDPTSLVPFYSQECRAFNGLALAIVRFQRGAAEGFSLRVTSPGLVATAQAVCPVPESV